jgi:hypothetical protein
MPRPSNSSRFYHPHNIVRLYYTTKITQKVSYEGGNEQAHFMKSRKFLEQLRECQIFKDDLPLTVDK